MEERVQATAGEGDPNFPSGGLAIKPSYDCTKHAAEKTWAQDSQEDIEQYGIAGRVWEAAYLLQRYLAPPASTGLEFDPPCSLVADDSTTATTAVELGAGAGVVGIDLAQTLSARRRANEDGRQDWVVLTDLDNVLSLLKRNVQRAGLLCDSETSAVRVTVEPLPWGSLQHVKWILDTLQIEARSLTHVLCSDLVYFPELLAPLLRSLISITSSTAATTSHASPQVIISYKIRSLAKEEPFWRGLGAWFEFAPVLCRRRRRCGAKNDDDWRRLGTLISDMHAASTSSPDASDTPAEDEIFVFVAQRRRDTLTCSAPTSDDRLLDGWLKQTDGAERQGQGVGTFEFILMAAMQA